MAEDSTNSNEGTSNQVSQSDYHRTYSMKDPLTIKNAEGEKTMLVTNWLSEDPVSFDIFRKEKKINIDTEVFNIMVSKLRAFHPQYFSDALGLKTKIKFKGHDYPVPAIVPYSNNPIEFYKWWCANQLLVHMSFKEKVLLFEKVFNEKPDTLKKEHKQLIAKK